MLAAAFSAGVRAPELLFELAPPDGLGEAYVMRRIGGTAIARKLLRDPPYETARGRIAGQLGEILARIHAVDPESLPPLVHREAADHIAGLRRALDALGHAAAGVRAGAVLARPAQAARRSTSRCWSTATTAPATISPTRRA